MPTARAPRGRRIKNRRRDRRKFSRTADREHRLNHDTRPMRGGFRL